MLQFIVPVENEVEKIFEVKMALADEWLSGKGVRLSILDIVLDTSSIPSSANKFNVSGLQ